MEKANLDQTERQKIQSHPPFSLNDFVKKYSSILSAFTLIITIAGVVWVLHTTLSDLNYRQGKLEGQMDLILQDRQNSLKNSSQQIFIIVTPTPIITLVPTIRISPK